ncbi:MAG: DUF2089 domain-containing protein [Tissierellaceae bacterium]|nr:DUF2089 domain-containing protein [Tissierellaceae bacterium]
MNREVIGKCPVCGKEMEVTRLSCNYCNTTIEGSFTLCKFCRLGDEQKKFAEIFIKNRGNIKEIEKELGISYPTVRNKLEDVIQALGYNPKVTTVNIDKKAILEKLKNGEISPEEAVKLLKGEE